MAEAADTMVLRSFHLPQRMDDELRALAFALRCPKADLLRFFIDRGLREIAQQYGAEWSAWDASTREAVAQEVDAGGSSQAVREGIRRDIARIGAEQGYAVAGGRG